MDMFQNQDPYLEELGILKGQMILVIKRIDRMEDCFQAGINTLKGQSTAIISRLDRQNGTIADLVQFKNEYETEAKDARKEQQRLAYESRQHKHEWKRMFWNGLLTLCIVLIAFVLQNIAGKMLGWHA